MGRLAIVHISAKADRSDSYQIFIGPVMQLEIRWTDGRMDVLLSQRISLRTAIPVQ
jgi:hypothetical protein